MQKVIREISMMKLKTWIKPVKTWNRRNLEKHGETRSQTAIYKETTLKKHPCH